MQEARGATTTDGKPCDADARHIALTFLEMIPAIRDRLAGDVQAAYDGDPAALNADEIILAYPGLLAISVQRLAHALHELGVPLMPRIMAEWAHLQTGIDVHPGARLGRNFFIDHGTGVVIGETTDIGDNVKVYQGVTLGALSFPKDERGRVIREAKRHPTVKDNVTIYANAIILGGDTVIGENSVIGGSVFVTSSVPPNSVVTFQPPELRVKQRAGQKPAPPAPEVPTDHMPDYMI
jgi:serine O-acetyltransferase